MVSHLVYYQLALLAIIWLFVMLHLTGAKPGLTTLRVPAKPKRKRSTEPKAFEGSTKKPHCAWCEQATGEDGSSASATARSHAAHEPTSPDGGYVHTLLSPHRLWLSRLARELNNLRANGHPSGGPWRQFHCTSCGGFFPEYHGTILHGKQAEVERIVHVLACLAEGLSIRATARIFEVEANTVLQWLVEAAEQLRAFSAYFLCEDSTSTDLRHPRVWTEAMRRSPQFEMDGEHDPDGNGPVPLSSGLKAPLFNSPEGSEIQSLVPRAALDQDVFDPSPLTDIDFEEGRPFNALPSGRFRIGGFDLIAPQGPGRRAHTAP